MRGLRGFLQIFARLRDERGFTLVETIVSAMIVAMAALAVSYQAAQQAKSTASINLQNRGKTLLKDVLDQVTAHPELFPAVQSNTGAPIVYVGCLSESGDQTVTYSGLFVPDTTPLTQQITGGPCPVNLGGVEIHVQRDAADPTLVDVYTVLLPFPNRTADSAVKNFHTTVNVERVLTTAVPTPPPSLRPRTPGLVCTPCLNFPLETLCAEDPACMPCSLASQGGGPGLTGTATDGKTPAQFHSTDAACVACGLTGALATLWRFASQPLDPPCTACSASATLLASDPTCVACFSDPTILASDPGCGGGPPPAPAPPAPAPPAPAPPAPAPPAPPAPPPVLPPPPPPPPPPVPPPPPPVLPPPPPPPPPPVPPPPPPTGPNCSGCSPSYPDSSGNCTLKTPANFGDPACGCWDQGAPLPCDAACAPGAGC